MNYEHEKETIYSFQKKTQGIFLNTNRSDEIVVIHESTKCNGKTINLHQNNELTIKTKYYTIHQLHCVRNKKVKVHYFKYIQNKALVNNINE